GLYPVNFRFYGPNISFNFRGAVFYFPGYPLTDPGITYAFSFCIKLVPGPKNTMMVQVVFWKILRQDRSMQAIQGMYIICPRFLLRQRLGAGLVERSAQILRQ